MLSQVSRGLSPTLSSRVANTVPELQNSKGRGHLPVNRDSSQGKAAGIHGKVDQEMYSLAGKGPKEPPIQGVNGGLERDTADDEA